MEFRPVEIIAIVIAIAVPVVGFTLLLIPGAFQGLLAFAFAKESSPYVFGALAVMVMAFLAFRIYRRIRPAPRRKRDPGAPPTFGDFLRLDLWRDPNCD